MDQKPLSIRRQLELLRINRVLSALVVLLSFATGILLAYREDWIKQPTDFNQLQSVDRANAPVISMPQPETGPLTTLLTQARWQRTLSAETISKTQLMDILWSAQGKITNWGERTVPSYRSVFPVKLKVLVRNVTDIEPGIYEFDAEQQSLLADEGEGAYTYPEMFPGLIDSPIVLYAIIPENLQTVTMSWHEAGAISQNILLSVTKNQLATFLLPASSLEPEFSGQFIQPGEIVLWFMPIGKLLTQ